MKLILHVGAEKTGSSYFQSLFLINESLFNKYQIFFPRPFGFTGVRAEFLLGLYGPAERVSDAYSAVNYSFSSMSSQNFAPGNGLESERLRLLYQISSGLTPHTGEDRCDILSEERLLSRLDAEQVYALLTDLKAIYDEILVILVWRAPSSMCSSIYNEYLKAGGTSSFGEWLSSNRYFRYDLEEYKKIWSQCGIKLLYVDYETRASDNYLLDEVLKLLNQKDVFPMHSLSVKGIRHNRTMGQAGRFITLSFNRLVGRDRRNLRRVFLWVVKRLGL